jgi:ABC-2 type transport system ATP-binding protein
MTPDAAPAATSGAGEAASGPGPAPAVSTRALSRRFGGAFAVDGLDLDVPAGALFGFLGPNGAGKSTTINILTGLLAPTAGEARVLGHDVVREPLEVKRRIGVVPDGFALFERLSGEEQLEFVGRMYGLGAAEAARRARDLLEALELGGDGRKLVAGYSHGMRKKLALGCALIHNPRVLFLDEPFEGVDAVAAKGIRDLLVRLAGRGHTTVFLTSHVLEIVERLCTHAAVIDRGRLRAHGRLEDLRRGPDGAPRSLEALFLELCGIGRTPGAGLDWLG